MAPAFFFHYQLIKLYILAYLVFRFLTEFICPEPEFFLGLTVYQWITVALFPLFIAIWLQTAWRVRNEACKPVAA